MLKIKFTIDSETELYAVHTQDDAIDYKHKDTDAVAYIKTGNLEFLQFKPGQEPTKFMFRALDCRREKNVTASSFGSKHAGDTGSGAGVLMFDAAFDEGVFEVRNAIEEGDVIPARKPSRTKKGSNICIKDLKIAGVIRREIGAHIARASGMVPQLREDDREDLEK